MYMFKDAFDLVLPVHLKGLWRSIKVFHKKDLNLARNILSNYNLTTEATLKAALEALKEVLMAPIDEEEDDDWVHSPRDVQDFLERFEDEQLYRRVIAPEYSIEDLLDSDNSDSLFNAEDEDSVLDFVDEGLEALVESDSEDEPEEVQLNTVRRLVRHFNQLARNSGTV
jgi:hypothetical protein